MEEKSPSRVEVGKTFRMGSIINFRIDVNRYLAVSVPEKDEVLVPIPGKRPSANGDCLDSDWTIRRRRSTIRPR